jgi:hypothetical protein
VSSVCAETREGNAKVCSSNSEVLFFVFLEDE